MSMNVFRIAADLSHVIAIFILLMKIIKTKSCRGISGRSQILFAAVYTTRYSDLLYNYISLYNTVMKILFLGASYLTVFFIFFIFRKTYESKRDTFITEILIVPSFMLALWVNYQLTPLEIFWTFSIYLEAVAILPQFYMIYKRKQIEKTVLYYLTALGLYRTLYIFNWLYRFFTEGHLDLISDGGGLIYTALYVLAIGEMLFNKIKLTENGEETYFKRNIFFISSNEPLGTEHLIVDPVQTEKTGTVHNLPIENV